ncbi:hypothetical protein GCM10009104_23050 [Marinobacterium maritimum]|uniref:Uncharacterized protein n=1 Tax=Marinobacterium maritimum TaxID=500162 RepID=A0ABP3TA99_9GAMM
MEPLKEITFYLEGLSETDKEKLLSVLVLAEIRLESSWVLQEQPGGADVCLSRGHGQSIGEHSGPVICYAEKDARFGNSEQEGVFFLNVDASGVPPFPDLVSIFNQVDVWISEQSRHESARLSDVGNDACVRPAGEQDCAVSSNPEPTTEMHIPTLVPVVDEEVAEISVPLRVATGSESEGVTGAGGVSRKLSWLGRVAEYVHNLEPDSYYHKILLQSGGVILLDLYQDRFYSSVNIESFLDGSGDNKTSYISSMDRQGFKTELNKQDYFERPFSNLKWFLALYSNVSVLDIDTDNQVYMLSAWPENDLPGLRREHLKLAAFMQAKRASVAEISAETGLSVDLIRSFVEACFYEGLVRMDQEPEQKHNSAPEKPKGFWGGVLRKIKW